MSRLLPVAVIALSLAGCSGDKDTPLGTGLDAQPSSMIMSLAEQPN